DLPKVTGMCEAAGCAVDFPWLDSAVVDFAGRLPAREKVHRGQLRYFVKNALADFLPDATLNKSKHGFGLPVGPWLTDDPVLHALARESLQGLVGRGVLRQPFVARLLEHDLGAHGAYFGQFVWVLMMLEQWIRRNEDGLAY
ncbi:MAG: asparagine synthase C-terminal domain-containing protein, partial [Gammaproteobacteria bacterium]|nr:asparagine synthase C-terminal domain-containing protein [Gammaproteobacteria bacterium]